MVLELNTAISNMEYFDHYWTNGIFVFLIMYFILDWFIIFEMSWDLYLSLQSIEIIQMLITNVVDFKTKKTIICIHCTIVLLFPFA